mmetsp:Transcript_51964/g.105849  ORF Transcript_51964/g.105849 Transcript_51964/m.105849 type:complete len:178 (-) Transcript_51964:185-718(-)|eukprot:CAMPEP_0181335306 /NCGR_PEP_ID=MMETSP1101-20121128/26759_1 /TAXON_ID=46948 /ORGANISM="Rhodomonas abbreviata, Strain Caron Lab Isolate" /LENGTH=177 /DNA_ID=CAMNT_0023445413 /DNA_START=45 /DNA_END=578 /DNA_ORIENTATION=+
MTRGMRRATLSLLALVVLLSFISEGESLKIAFAPLGHPPGRMDRSSETNARIARPGCTRPSMCSSGGKTPDGGGKGDEKKGFFGALMQGLFPSQEEVRKAQVELMRRREGRRALRQTVKEKKAPVVKSRYVPPEQSPSGQRTRESIMEEQRVQWEAMREGNRVRQNDILTKTISRGG